MGNLRRTFLPLALVLAVLMARPTYADDCRVGLTPDGVYPVDDPDIALVEEEVTVTLSRESPRESWAECVFAFQNEGPAKEILMGFPAAADITADFQDAPTAADRTSFHDFRTFRIYPDGSQEEIPVSLETSVAPPGRSEETPRYSSWYVFPVSFKAGERVVLKNTYRTKNTVWSNGEVGTGYVLRTGALWKGPIGRARVTVDLGGIPLHALTDLSPGTFRVEPERLVWEARDIEPSFDLSVRFSIRLFSEDEIEAMGEEFEREVERRKEAFARVLALDPADHGEELRTTLRLCQSENDLVLGRLIGSMLGEPAEHIPSFDPDGRPTFAVWPEPGPTQPDEAIIRSVLFDAGADVLEAGVKVLEGERSPYRVVCESSYSLSGYARFSLDIAATIPDWKGPSERYVICLFARDSAGSETTRRYVFTGGEIREESELSPVFPMPAMVTGAAVALVVAVAAFVTSRRRRRPA